MFIALALILLTLEELDYLDPLKRRNVTRLSPTLVLHYNILYLY